MIRNNDIISPYQLAMITIMTIISIEVFSLAAEAADELGTDGWLVIVILGIINIFAALVIIRLNSIFPGKTIAEYSQIVIGTIPGKILTGLFAVYLIIVIAYVTRVFTEVVKMFLLFRTPTEVIMLSLILVCTYAVRGGVECVARINELIFPILFIPFFIVLLFGFPVMDFSNLLPVLQTPPDKVLASIPRMIFSYGGIELALYYIGFMKEPGKAYKPLIISVIFILLFFVMITVFCIAAFGAKAVTKIIWPLAAYIRTVSLPGVFLERLDGVILSLWVLTVFTTIVSVLFIVSYSISKVAGTKEQKQFVLPLVMIIYYLALQPESLAELYEWGNLIFPYAVAAFMYVVPAALLLTAKLRKMGVKRNESN